MPSISSQEPTPNPSRKSSIQTRRLTFLHHYRYKHGVIKDLIAPGLLRNVRSEIQKNLSFTPKETDIYRIHQSGDLANLDGLDDSSLKLLPSLLNLRNALYSSVFRDYLSTVTGSGPLSGRKTDMAINVYTPGCHLLCHDDAIGSRKVSYILYLTDPDTTWKEEWGGALRLYPTVSRTTEDGNVLKIPGPDHEASIPPAFNQLSFFAVQPGESFHDVEEVYASQSVDGEGKDDVRVRTAISGWYHIPQIGEEGYVGGLEEKLAEKSSLTQLQGKADIFDLPKANIHSPIGLDLTLNTNESGKTPDLLPEEDPALSEDDLSFLLKYIAPLYLTPDTLEQVSEIFAAQCSLTLDEILSPNFSDALRTFIAGQDTEVLPSESSEIEKTTPWKVARPPHKHRFLFQQAREKKYENQSPLEDLLENLLPSLPFYKWLQLATGQIVSSHNLTARRFRRGKDYTLATGYDEDDSRLEITLAITPTPGWEPEAVAVPGQEAQPEEPEVLQKVEQSEEPKEEPEPAEESEARKPSAVVDPEAESKEGTSQKEELKGEDLKEEGLKKEDSKGESTGLPTQGDPEEEAQEGLHTQGDPEEEADSKAESTEGLPTQGNPEAEDSEGESTEALPAYNDPEEDSSKGESTEAPPKQGDPEEEEFEGESTEVLPAHGDSEEDDSRGESNEGLLIHSNPEEEDSKGESTEAPPAHGGPEEDSKGESTGALPAQGDPETGAEGEVDGGSNNPASGDVGGYVAYMAGDDDATGGQRAKIDPAVYQADGEEGALFSMPAGWNKLGIVLRDRGVLRFVKYVSERAKGDRWDICGEYAVVNQDDDGDTVMAGDYSTDYSEMETEEDTTTDDD